MSLFFSNARVRKVIAAGWSLVDGAIGLGLISGAAVATAFGKFVLGGLLAVFALGILARLTRLKARGGQTKSTRQG